MNLEQVAQSISNPAVLTLADAPGLKALSEKHPYAAVFSLLYLTALANGKSIDLDSALQQHAYRLNDRAQLYQLVHKPGEATSDPIEFSEPETLEIPVEAVPATEVEVRVEEVVQKIAEQVEEPIASATTEEPETAPEPVMEAPERNDFDTITEAFTLEQHFDITKPETPVAELPEEEAVEEVSETERERETERVVEFEPGEKRSFTSWLKSSGQKPVEPAAKAPEKRKVDEIIDHFIKEEPTITRGKTEFFSPPKKAKESLDEDTIPVSETLAKIYAAQGNYPKAIHVYHQLMLAFPEKKLLFAVRIEELKKKITS